MTHQKNKHKSLVPQHILNNKQETNYLNKNVAIKSYRKDGNNATVLMCLRYIQEEYQCFSEWTQSEISAFYNFNRQIHNYTWQQVLEQGGKPGKKVGFGYTLLPRNLYPSENFKAQLSPDVDFFELRINQKARVHGFRDESIFYLCWLDRNHSITT